MLHDLLPRTMVSIFSMILIAIAGIFAPSPILSLLVLAFVVVASNEWTLLAGMNRLHRILYPLFTLAIGAIFYLYQNTSLVLSFQSLLLVLSSIFWTTAVPLLLIYNQAKSWNPMRLPLAYTLGWIILFGFWASVISLRSINIGLLFELALLVILCDSTAYISGSIWGKTALCPSISPNKSFEGAFFAWIAVLVAVMISKLIAFPYGICSQCTWSQTILLASILFILAVTGDLFESLLKRSVDLKDSGVFFPGHGGIFDRIDSWFPVLAVFALFTQY